MKFLERLRTNLKLMSLKRQARRGGALLKEYGLDKELEEIIDYAIKEYGMLALEALGGLAKNIMINKPTFDTKEEYVRWLSWRLRNYKEVIDQWAEQIWTE